MTLEMLDKSVRRVPDFPKKGILFYDITGVLVNPEAFKFVLEKCYEIYKDAKIDAVAGVESRGFIFDSDSCSWRTCLVRLSWGSAFKKIICTFI